MFVFCGLTCLVFVYSFVGSACDLILLLVLCCLCLLSPLGLCAVFACCFLLLVGSGLGGLFSGLLIVCCFYWFAECGFMLLWFLWCVLSICGCLYCFLISLVLVFWWVLGFVVS